VIVKGQCAYGNGRNTGRRPIKYTSIAMATVTWDEGDYGKKWEYKQKTFMKHVVITRSFKRRKK
jgi:hypothetical protein